MANSEKKKLPIPASSLLIILGLILVIFKNAAPETILRILAAGLLVVSVLGLIQQIRDKESKKSSRFGRGFVNVILIALGIAILAATGFFAGFAKYVLGGVMILFGLKDIIPAIRYKQGWLKIILSIVALVLGCYLIFFPPESMVLFAGLSLVYCGFASIFNESKKG